MALQTLGVAHTRQFVQHNSKAMAIGLLAACLAVAQPQSLAQQATGPLHVHPTNPRYFADGTGKAVYLTGSHTWSNLPDHWTNSYNVTFDYPGYLDFLQQHNHNFIRMWRAELPQYRFSSNAEYRFSTPHPWKKVVGQNPGGPPIIVDGDGADDGMISFPGSKPAAGEPGGGQSPGGTSAPGGGGPPGDGQGSGKYDLTQFNDAYFQRLRERCIAAGERGIYVSIMLFEGYGLAHTTEGWAWHPFNAANNINGINGDLNGDGIGIEIHTLDNPSVTTVEESYVKHLIDTVNDLDNVMYEIANECLADSIEWQNHMIEVVHAYEAGKPKQHPVLFSTPFPYSGDALWQSNAEALSPTAYSPNGSYSDDPPPADGTKVVISDTDHIFGCGGDVAWVWKSFTRGLNVIYMDSYYDDTPFCSPPNEGIRLNMGYTLSYAKRMNLSQTLPHGELASTGFCLAQPGAAYLSYSPVGGSISMNLSAAAGSLNVEWLDPDSGGVTTAAPVQGGTWRTLSSPFSGDAVLFVFDPNAAPPPGNIPGDVNGDGHVDVSDLLAVINAWGHCPTAPASCPADLNGDGVVNVDDLLVVIANWG